MASHEGVNLSPKHNRRQTASARSASGSQQIPRKPVPPPLPGNSRPYPSRSSSLPRNRAATTLKRSTAIRGNSPEKANVGSLKVRKTRQPKQHEPQQQQSATMDNNHQKLPNTADFDDAMDHAFESLNDTMLREENDATASTNTMSRQEADQSIPDTHEAASGQQPQPLWRFTYAPNDTYDPADCAKWFEEMDVLAAAAAAAEPQVPPAPSAEQQEQPNLRRKKSFGKRAVEAIRSKSSLGRRDASDSSKAPSSRDPQSRQTSRQEANDNNTQNAKTPSKRSQSRKPINTLRKIMTGGKHNDDDDLERERERERGRTRMAKQNEDVGKTPSKKNIMAEFGKETMKRVRRKFSISAKDVPLFGVAADAPPMPNFTRQGTDESSGIGKQMKSVRDSLMDYEARKDRNLFPSGPARSNNSLPSPFNDSFPGNAVYPPQSKKLSGAKPARDLRTEFGHKDDNPFRVKSAENPFKVNTSNPEFPDTALPQPVFFKEDQDRFSISPYLMMEAAAGDKTNATRPSFPKRGSSLMPTDEFTYELDHVNKIMVKVPKSKKEGRSKSDDLSPAKTQEEPKSSPFKGFDYESELALGTASMISRNPTVRKPSGRQLPVPPAERRTISEAESICNLTEELAKLGVQTGASKPPDLPPKDNSASRNITPGLLMETLQREKADIEDVLRATYPDGHGQLYKPEIVNMKIEMIWIGPGTDPRIEHAQPQPAAPTPKRQLFDRRLLRSDSEDSFIEESSSFLDTIRRRAAVADWQRELPTVAEEHEEKTPVRTFPNSFPTSNSVRSFASDTSVVTVRIAPVVQSVQSRHETTVIRDETPVPAMQSSMPTMGSIYSQASEVAPVPPMQSSFPSMGSIYSQASEVTQLPAMKNSLPSMGSIYSQPDTTPRPQTPQRLQSPDLPGMPIQRQLDRMSPKSRFQLNRAALSIRVKKSSTQNLRGVRRPSATRSGRSGPMSSPMNSSGVDLTRFRVGSSPSSSKTSLGMAELPKPAPLTAANLVQASRSGRPARIETPIDSSQFGSSPPRPVARAVNSTPQARNHDHLFTGSTTVGTPTTVQDQSILSDDNELEEEDWNGNTDSFRPGGRERLEAQNIAFREMQVEIQGAEEQARRLIEKARKDAEQRAAQRAHDEEIRLRRQNSQKLQRQASRKLRSATPGRSNREAEHRRMPSSRDVAHFAGVEPSSERQRVYRDATPVRNERHDEHRRMPSGRGAQNASFEPTPRKQHRQVSSARAEPAMQEQRMYRETSNARAEHAELRRMPSNRDHHSARIEPSSEKHVAHRDATPARTDRHAEHHRMQSVEKYRDHRQVSSARAEPAMQEQRAYRDALSARAEPATQHQGVHRQASSARARPAVPEQRVHREAPAERDHRDTPIERVHRQASSARAKPAAPEQRVYREAPTERVSREASSAKAEPAIRDERAYRAALIERIRAGSSASVDSAAQSQVAHRQAPTAEAEPEDDKNANAPFYIKDRAEIAREREAMMKEQSRQREARREIETAEGLPPDTLKREHEELLQRERDAFEAMRAEHARRRELELREIEASAGIYHDGDPRKLENPEGWMDLRDPARGGPRERIAPTEQARNQTIRDRMMGVFNVSTRKLGLRAPTEEELAADEAAEIARHRAETLAMLEQPRPERYHIDFRHPEFRRLLKREEDERRRRMVEQQRRLEQAARDQAYANSRR